MRRDFVSREELAAYLGREFPAAAVRDSAISPWPGGLAEARRRLDQFDPRPYAATRNHLEGAVTHLSPYIRHGIISLDMVRKHAIATAGSARAVQKFLTELAWRDYWQRLYAVWGEEIWRDREEYKTGWTSGDYSPELPEDIRHGATHLACMDAFSHELHTTGYLHNHARMWLAAYVVHWRRVMWQAGARWFLLHLLDGYPASNNLSWQWVASTFSHKPYFFNRENVEKYTDGLYCGACAARSDCPFNASYEQLSDRLFRVKAGTP